MPTSNQITKANDKLDKTLDDLLVDDLKMIKGSIKRLENNIIDQLHTLPINDDGSLRMQRSLKSAQQFHKEIIKEVALEYGVAVNNMVTGYSTIEKAIETRFKDVSIPLHYTTVDREMFRALKKQIKYEMTTLGVKTTQDITSGMYDMILSGSKFSDLVDLVRNELTGIKTKAGKPLSSYASQQIHDTLMGYYSQVEQVKAKDAKLDTYLYYGNLMESSRAFCIARAGRVFTRRQIDSWNNFRWQGKKPGSVFINRGGYNCRHSFMVVRKSWVKDGKIKNETYWTQPGMEMDAKLTKEVAAEERKLDSYSGKPLAWQKAANVKDLKNQFKEQFKINDFEVTGLWKADEKAVLNIGNKVGEELITLSKNNPALKFKELNRLEANVRDYLRYKDGKRLAVANGLFYSEPKIIQVAVGKYYDPQTKKLSRIAGAKDVIQKHNWNPFKSNSTDWMTTLRHELGHHADLPSLPGEGRFPHFKLFNSKEKSYFTRNISLYAGTNPKEMIAEAFSLASSPDYKKGVLPQDIERIVLPMTKGVEK